QHQLKNHQSTLNSALRRKLFGQNRKMTVQRMLNMEGTTEKMTVLRMLNMEGTTEKMTVLRMLNMEGTTEKMTVQRMLNMEGTTEKMKDRYHLLRIHNIKVYDNDFLVKQPVMKREYIRFRMDEALRLLRIGTPKSQIDGLVNIGWRFKQRKNKYKSEYTRAQTEILELDGKIQEKEKELFEQIRKGIIGQQSKNIFFRNELMCFIDSIAKNWEVAVRKWEQCGPPKKKKRGRKTTSAVVFKTASELKCRRTEKQGDAKEPIYFKNVKDVLPMFIGIFQKACDVWKRDNTEPLTVHEAINEIAAETWWPTTPGAVPKSPVQLVTEFYLNSMKKNKRQAMVITLKPNHTFVVLINENGDQLMLDSHLHYSSENRTYHETLVKSGTGTAIAFLPSGTSPQWLVEDYPAIINSSSSYGEITQIIPKN
ncbi:hypothetical protein ACJMK2_008748, partial [Sinanodonta woodiana]